MAFIYIQTTEDGVLRFLREKLRKGTVPNTMSSTLEGDIMKSIPAISSETYGGLWQENSCLVLAAEVLKSRFLLASLHIEAILRGTRLFGGGKHASR